jgi:hypothetical protein
MGLTGARCSLVSPIAHVNVSFDVMRHACRGVAHRDGLDACIPMGVMRLGCRGVIVSFGGAGCWRVVCRFVMRIVPHVAFRVVSASVSSLRFAYFCRKRSMQRIFSCKYGIYMHIFGLF